SNGSTHLGAMTQSCAQPPMVKPRQSLSGRLWLLATLAVLLSEIVVFLPYIAHERSNWLIGRLEDSSIAVLAAAGTPLDPARRDELLRLSGVEGIRLTGQDRTLAEIGDAMERSAGTIDLRQEDLFTGIRRAIRALIIDDDRLIRVVDKG